MKYLKYTQYAYLIAGALFLVDGFMKWKAQEPNAFIILGLGIVAIGMFFFRRKFGKKFEDRSNNS